LTRHFAAIVSAEDTPSSKPAPDPYLRAVALVGATHAAGLAAAECVAIEDSLQGLESARRAGLRTIGVAQTFPSHALDADYVVDSIDRIDVDRLVTWAL